MYGSCYIAPIDNLIYNSYENQGFCFYFGGFFRDDCQFAVEGAE